MTQPPDPAQPPQTPPQPMPPQMPPPMPQQDGAAEPPPYAPAGAPGPAPYAVVTGDQRAAWEKRSIRHMAVGALWFLAGLIITLVTYSNASASSFGGVYVVAWGPMLYGGIRVVYGGYLMWKAKR